MCSVVGPIIVWSTSAIVTFNTEHSCWIAFVFVLSMATIKKCVCRCVCVILCMTGLWESEYRFCMVAQRLESIDHQLVSKELCLRLFLLTGIDMLFVWCFFFLLIFVLIFLMFFFLSFSILFVVKSQQDSKPGFVCERVYCTLFDHSMWKGLRSVCE